MSDSGSYSESEEEVSEQIYSDDEISSEDEAGDDNPISFGDLNLGGDEEDEFEDLELEHDSDEEEGVLYPGGALEFITRPLEGKPPDLGSVPTVPQQENAPPLRPRATGGRSIMAAPPARSTVPSASTMPPPRVRTTVLVPPPPIAGKVPPPIAGTKVPPPPIAGTKLPPPPITSTVQPIPKLTLNVRPGLGSTTPGLGSTTPTPSTPKFSTQELTEKLAGIDIAGVTPAPNPVSADINDLLHVEASESDEDFEARRRLTLRLATIPNYPINNSTAVTLGHMMMKKSRLGIMFDTDIESSINQVLKLVE